MKEGITLTLEKDLIESARILARKEGRSISNLIQNKLVNDEDFMEEIQKVKETTLKIRESSE